MSKWIAAAALMLAHVMAAQRQLIKGWWELGDVDPNMDNKPLPSHHANLAAPLACPMPGCAVSITCRRRSAALGVTLACARCRGFLESGRR